MAHLVLASLPLMAERRFELMVGFGATLILLMPKLALACAVCFDPNEASNDAFMWSTIFLSLLPLAVIGTVVWWVFRQFRTEKASENENLPGAVSS